MSRCDQVQPLALDYLYDLLEPAERRDFEEHLTGCPACRDALTAAGRQRDQIAAAARLSFPGVRFVAPEEPSAVRFPRAGGGFTGPGSFRWAVAAGVLLAAAGLLVPRGLVWQQRGRVSQVEDRLQQIREQAKKVDADYLVRLEHADDEIRELEQQVQTVARERQQQLARVHNATRDPKHLRLSVSGPRSPEAGVPNAYRIETKSWDYRPVSARLSVRVLDDRRQVVYQQDDVRTDGNHALVLPPNLPLTPEAGLALEVIARGADGAEEKLSEALPLVAPQYRTYLTTDKPLYQPGEVVRFRSLTLERFSLRPASDDLQLTFTVTKPNGEQAPPLFGSTRLITERGQPVLGPDGQPVRGIGTGEYRLDANAEGGEYTLSVRDAQDRFPAQQRKFLVNRYEKPRLHKELHFARASYGPGETVTATCKVVRADDNRPAAGLRVTAGVNVDGQAVAPQVVELRTDAAGAVDVRFTLPPRIERGAASLTVTFGDGGSVETLVRPVPVVLKKLQIEFFPEGGDLVAGVPNRVYFQVRSPLGKPAELAGKILDEQGGTVAVIRTRHDLANPGANLGMGHFELTPAVGKRYRLQVQEPAGIEELTGPDGKDGRFLPQAKDDGVVLSVPSGVTTAPEPIRVVVRSARHDRKLLIGAYCRGRLMAEKRLQAKAGAAASVELRPQDEAGGVYRVTVFEESGDGRQASVTPRAERLIYRTPARRLSLAVRPDKDTYTPGERVTLVCEAADEQGRSAPAILLVAVTDNGVHRLANDLSFRQLPTHFYLTTEVRQPEDLEYADFLLSGHASAAAALDLLLGTQGWRRFVEQAPGRPRNPADPARALAFGGPAQTRTVDVDGQKLQAIETAAAARLTELGDRLARAEEGRAALRQDEQLQAERQRLDGESASLHAAYQEAVATLERYRAVGDSLRRWLLPVLAAALLLGLLTSLAAVLRPQRGLPRAVPYAVVAGGFAAVVAFLVSWQLGSAAVSPGATFALDVPAWSRPPAQEQVALAPRPTEGAPAKGMAPRAMMRPQAAMMKKAMPRPAAAPAGRPDIQARPLFRPALPPERHPHQAGLRRPPGTAGFVAPQAASLGGAERGGLARVRRLMGPATPTASAAAPALVVREYAHQHQPPTNGVRSDFTDTLLWHPVLVLPDGKAEVSFDLSDSATTFQVHAAGHTADGRLGAVTTALTSRLPLTLEPKLPLEVTAGDRLDIPLAIANNAAAARTVQVDVRAQNLTLLDGTGTRQLPLGAGERGRLIYRLKPAVVDGEARLQFDGRSEGAADRILRTVRVVPEGFPVVGSQSDLLEKTARTEFTLPADLLPGTLQCQVAVYPSPLADLQKGLEALLREPNGCFEQTSSSNYPNVLILEYLRDNGPADPEVVRQAQALLQRGYQKLVSFECRDPAANRKEGYEWFGGTVPPHEALTAYGLLQFRDMARVQDVDPTMLERTRHYLLGQKDGQGGFKRNPRAVDTFGRAPEAITNAYIVWALTESGNDDVTRELAALQEQAKASKDPYFLALVANGLLNRSQTEPGLALLQRLAAAQHSDGHLDAARTSITGSGGRDLQIETTALTLLAWLKAQRPERFTTNVQRAVQWLGRQRGGHGGFGSTQSTILALKALIAYAKAHKQTAEAGEVVLFAGQTEIARQRFPAQATKAVELSMPEPQKHLHAGKNVLRVEITGQNVFPYTLTWSYRTRTPASTEGCAVRLQTNLDRSQAAEGESVRLTATLENVSSQGQGMTVAVIGLPAGLTLPEDMKQLKDLTRSGTISFWELRGRELVLYWRDLAPGRRVTVTLDLICRVPGEYHGPASRAYLYYNADHKCWVAPLPMHITPKN